MVKIPLTATARDDKRSAKVLRRLDRVPCVVYGGKQEHMTVDCGYNELFKAFVQAGENTLVDLDTGSKKVPVLFHALQFDPVSSRITHVDFYAVDMTKEVDADIPVRLEGESLAVKELAAVLVTVTDHIGVRCLPANLPHHIAVSIESLKEFHDSVHVRDIILPPGVTLLMEPDTVIATVQEPRKEEEIAPPPVTDEAAAAAAATEAATAEGASKEEGEKSEEKK